VQQSDATTASLALSSLEPQMVVDFHDLPRMANGKQQCGLPHGGDFAQNSVSNVDSIRGRDSQVQFLVVEPVGRRWYELNTIKKCDARGDNCAASCDPKK
jgi:hypothetical protein